MALSGIPHSSTAKLWDQIALLIRGNTALVNVLKLLVIYEGKTTDLDKYTKANLPAVVFTPGSQGSGWSAEVQHDAPLIVNIEIVMGSTYAGDVMDLWWAIVGVFFPGDNSILNSLRVPYGVYMITMTDPTWSVKILDDGSRSLAAVGSLKFDQHLNT